MLKIETILTPALFPLYKEGLENKNVVVIDILRATTTICVAFGNGAEKIIPVGSPEEALLFRNQGFLVAAERNGKTVEGFELGNSPQDYSMEKVKGKKIAITTTNGTRTLRLCNDAAGVFIGSFLNITFLTQKLIEDNKDILLFCSGWKDKFNLEDTLFAGAVLEKLKHSFEVFGDASQMALDLYTLATPNMVAYLQKASHVQRFKTLHVESDLEVCLKTDTIHVAPVYHNGNITL